MSVDTTGNITEDVAAYAGQHIALDSSFLRSCYYDASTQTLDIVMNNREYTLHGVPPDEFIGLISAASPGSYFNERLRGKY